MPPARTRSLPGRSPAAAAARRSGARRIAHHQPARTLGVHTDDLEGAAWRTSNTQSITRLQHPAIDRLEVLLRRQVDDDRRRLTGQPLVQVVGDARAPELVQVAPALGGQGGAHLQPVGPHAVQRAQHAVQAAQDAQVLLQPVQLGGGQRAGLQPFVDVAVEGQHGLARLARAEARAPGLVARDVQAGQRVAQLHEGRDLCRRLLAQHLDQCRSFRHEQRLRVRQIGRQRRVVVERLGGRQ